MLAEQAPVHAQVGPIQPAVQCRGHRRIPSAYDTEIEEFPDLAIEGPRDRPRMPGMTRFWQGTHLGLTERHDAARIPMAFKIRERRPIHLEIPIVPQKQNPTPGLSQIRLLKNSYGFTVPERVQELDILIDPRGVLPILAKALQGKIDEILMHPDRILQGELEMPMDHA
jgi:hypothetical protein